MKTRNWICYTLDFLGITALIGAAAALCAALWFNGSMLEGVMLGAFGYALMGTVGSFLAARMWEIAGVLRRGAPSVAAPVAPPSNVEPLPKRLPHAA